MLGPDASPTEVTVISAESKSLTLSWKPPPESSQNGVITGYEIRLQLAGERENGVCMSPISKTVNTTEATVTGLCPFTEYAIQVRAMNIAGDSDFSILITNTTDEDRKCIIVIIILLIS